MRVFGDVNSGNCFKVKLLMHHLQIPYEWVHIDVLRHESHTADFLKLNPKGQIPVLEISPGVTLSESNAILHYLADETEYLPSSRKSRADTLQWMFFEQYMHEPAVAAARYIVRYLGRPPEHEQMLKKRIEAGYKALDQMELHLLNRAFFVDERYTIADIALYAYTHVADEGGFDLGWYPAVRAWIERVQRQSGYVAMGIDRS